MREWVGTFLCSSSGLLDTRLFAFRGIVHKVNTSAHDIYRVHVLTPKVWQALVSTSSLGRNFTDPPTLILPFTRSVCLSCKLFTSSTGRCYRLAQNA